MLERIEKPQDLKSATYQELNQLASEMREELVKVVSANGGHLASNLGAVELTIALHRVFDSPRDKIIWDVGHQAYPHKLLTGRQDRFASLRQYEGLSGYTCRDESEHDPFGAGHASTSISAALGMAIARDLSGDDYQVIAVIGDGAITGGMALEALNHAGHIGSRLIVVLNDNGMSISPTVGALARLLGKVRFNHRYNQAREKGKQLITHLPLGEKIRQAGQQLESGVKGLVMPTTLWEDLGFAYFGPFDGHNIREMEKAFTRARNYSGRPVLIHAITTKGKGYLPAEGDAVYFHGVSANKKDAVAIPTYSDVFAQTMLRLMKEDPRVAVITPAMPEGNCLSPVQEVFPERVFDVGICEQHAVTLAAGLATQGYRPVVAIYSTFLQRAFDQIIHDVCLQDLPVTFALDRSGIVGDDGKTHQGAFDLSYLAMIPNLVVSSPRDENELQHLLYTAVNLGHPMAVRYPRSSGLGVSLDEELHMVPTGKGEVLREGSDIALVGVGATVAPALAAAEELARKGIEATVVDARYIKPLDTERILNIAGQVKCLVTIEENALIGGFGSRITRLLQQSDIIIRVSSIGLPDEFVEHGSPSILRAKYNLDAPGIVRVVLSLFPDLASVAGATVSTEQGSPPAG